MGGAPTIEPDRLLPFTRLVLAVSAVVQIFFGIDGALGLGRLFWSAPLPVWPREVMIFVAPTYIATGLAAAFAFYQNRWTGARVYFTFSFTYVTMSLVAVAIVAVHPGMPPLMWAYVFLSVLYLPAVGYSWWRQLRVTAPLPG